MINTIIKNLRDVSLSQKKGRFLSDKSYGFDTVFFIAKFIIHNSKRDLFNRRELRESATEYTEDLFNLRPGTAGAVNYFVETVNLFEYANIIEKVDSNNYRIINPDILEFIGKLPENAYIFLYLLTYMTYKNDGIWPLFEKYCSTKNVEKKEDIANSIFSVFSSKSTSIEDKETNWSKQLVKYSLTILGYINEEYYIARTLRVHDRIWTVEDIALNVAGTRTPITLPKKNDYISKFSKDYVANQLKPYLISVPKIEIAKTEITESIASGLADIKLEMIDLKKVMSIDSKFDKQQFIEIENQIKRRNPSIQSEFRKSLFENNKSICTICSFSYRDFLIASHIKPYAICKDTYDAINHFNGLLLCPNHDKLFEGAKHMTIDYRTGEIILNDSAKRSKEFGMLNGKSIDKRLVQCERKHYLQWHNEQFEKNR
ncbi:MAG: hypothetical protein BWY15_00848 [Firmicutes bacterium ADurb.Bin193]|nr:MAG: hypothetical protein BWY15_00848 [Firmicutes bacterium ADurb.Bin193]